MNFLALVGRGSTAIRTIALPSSELPVPINVNRNTYFAHGKWHPIGSPVKRRHMRHGQLLGVIKEGGSKDAIVESWMYC